MSSIVIFGASGFLGNALLASAELIGPVKAIVRSIPVNLEISSDHVTWIEADFMNPASLSGVLFEGDIVINLAFIQDGSCEANIILLNNIIDACVHSNVSKLIHCSTATVVGGAKTGQVNELSQCNPSTSYEKIKYSLEQLVLKSAERGLDVGIIRPTAIIGAGSQNLVKLAQSLVHGKPLVNYLKSCVLGTMPMHLVPVRNVVAVLLHLSNQVNKLEGSIFIVSSDKDPDNNFKKVKQILINEFNLAVPRFPYIFIPKILQVLIFKILNRTDINMDRTYEETKVGDLGIVSVDSVSAAVKQFANAFELERLVEPTINNSDVD